MSRSDYSQPLLHSQANTGKMRSSSSPTHDLSSPPTRRRPRPTAAAYARSPSGNEPLVESASHHTFAIPQSPNLDDSPDSPVSSTSSATPTPRAATLQAPTTAYLHTRRHSLRPSASALQHTAHSHSHAGAAHTPSNPAPTTGTFPSWPGTHQLRRLFRYFDRDGDGLISSTELRAGLSALGFDVSRYTSLSRFSTELHADSAGMIKESSFVRAFRKLNREKIVEELQRGEKEEEEEAKDMTIIMVEIGEEHVRRTQPPPQPHDNNSGGSEQREDERTLEPEQLIPQGRYAEHTFQPSQLSSYLIPSSGRSEGGGLDGEGGLGGSNSSHWSNKVTWIDINGLHTPTLSFLSNHFSLPPSTFDPALIGLDSVARIEYDHDALHDCGVMSVLMHAVSIDALPYRKKSAKERQREKQQSNKQHAMHNHYTDEHTLLSDYQYRIHRPSLTSLPIHIIIIGTHTVISIHPLTATAETSNIFSEFRSLLSQSVLHQLPFSSSSSSSSSLIGMRMSTAKTLALELLDEITDWNWSLRDIFKQWKVLVSDTLSEGYVSAGLLEHIHDLENLSLRATRLVAPQARMLQELLKELEEEEETIAHMHVDSSSKRGGGSIGDGGGSGGSGINTPHFTSLSANGQTPRSSIIAPTPRHTHSPSLTSTNPTNIMSSSIPEASTIRSSTTTPPIQNNGPTATGTAGIGPLRRDKSIFSSLDNLRSPSPHVHNLRLQRALFLSDISLDLRNLSKSVTRLSDQLKLTNELSSPLLSYYKQRKDEETNKILYVLTVVTTIVTPLQLSTGVYGMNFKYVPEFYFEWRSVTALLAPQQPNHRARTHRLILVSPTRCTWLRVALSLCCVCCTQLSHLLGCEPVHHSVYRHTVSQEAMALTHYIPARCITASTHGHTFLSQCPAITVQDAGGHRTDSHFNSLRTDCRNRTSTSSSLSALSVR